MRTKLLKKLRKEAEENYRIYERVYLTKPLTLAGFQHSTYIQGVLYLKNYNLPDTISSKVFIRNSILEYVRKLKYSQAKPFNSKDLKKASKRLIKFKVK